jgi:hypothetical protein
MSADSTAASACALVILSSDARQDLWTPCLALYRRYWPDCPYPIFLVSETIEARIAPAQSLRAGAVVAWSDVTRLALEALTREYVLLMLDDFFLTAPVDTRAVEAKRLQLERTQGTCLRLGPWPGPSTSMAWAPEIGEHEPGRPFRASLQPAFWRRRALIELLVPGESPWDFERAGSTRTDARSLEIYASRRAVLPFSEVITRGRWYRHGLRLCHREGLPADARRPVLSLFGELGRVRTLCRQILTGPRLYRLRRRVRRLVGG